MVRALGIRPVCLVDVFLSSPRVQRKSVSQPGIRAGCS